MRHHSSATHVAVVFMLDGKTDRVVRSLWQHLSDVRVSSKMIAMGSQPHVTLCIFNKTDVDELMVRVRAFAADHVPFDLCFSSAGTFGGEAGVVFLAPVVTTHLLALHHSLHKVVAGVDAEPWAHYLPGNWVPHCTTGFNVPSAQLGQALTLTRECGLPLMARVKAVAVVAFDPSSSLKQEWLEHVPLSKGE